MTAEVTPAIQEVTFRYTVERGTLRPGDFVELNTVEWAFHSRHRYEAEAIAEAERLAEREEYVRWIDATPAEPAVERPEEQP